MNRTKYPNPTKNHDYDIYGKRFREMKVSAHDTRFIYFYILMLYMLGINHEGDKEKNARVHMKPQGGFKLAN